VAVIVPCHNYGQYLAECLESVLTQTAPAAEVLVIDDASTDDTPAVAARFTAAGVRYERLECRDVYRVRQHGLRVTTSPFVVFLDADDRLHPTYLADGLQALSDQTVGVAFSDLQEFGDRASLRQYAVREIERDNFIHAGSMARRVALEQSQALELPHPPTDPTHADWVMWRAVLRQGWRAAKSCGTYYYRQHADAMSRRRRSYYSNANLDAETVQIVLPLAGRERYWPDLARWVETQHWPHVELLVLDTSDDPAFRHRVRCWLASLPCATTYVPLPPHAGLADADRRGNSSAYRSVQLAMPRLYGSLRGRLSREYVLIVEDDVLPPPDAIPRLLQGMDRDVAAVSAVVPSRWVQRQVIAWDDRRQHVRPQRGGLAAVRGTGFGCLLLRRSVYQSLPLHHGGESGNYDQEFSADVARLGLRWLICWDLRCTHAGIALPTEVDHERRKATAIIGHPAPRANAVRL
jgi:glycosyltransferase involved in cell wall biosynthesis